MPARKPLDYDRLTDETMFYYGLIDVADDTPAAVRESEAELLDKEKLCQDMRRQFRGRTLPGVEVELLEELSDAPRV